jgi:hypothetical protein
MFSCMHIFYGLNPWNGCDMSCASPNFLFHCKLDTVVICIFVVNYVDGTCDTFILWWIC